MHPDASPDVTVSEDRRRVSVDWPDGRSVTAPAPWLFDNAEDIRGVGGHRVRGAACAGGGAELGQRKGGRRPRSRCVSSGRGRAARAAGGAARPPNDPAQSAALDHRRGRGRAACRLPGLPLRRLGPGRKRWPGGPPRHRRSSPAPEPSRRRRLGRWRGSATSARPTTVGCSTFARRRSRPISPTRPSAWSYTPTIPTAIRFPPCRRCT